MSDLPSRLGPPLALSHCLEDQFLERFRADISGAEREVIVLSPFLSKNRASQYYAAFAATVGRGVNVTVYARPKWEQPGTLVDHFNPVKRRLEAAGVAFATRQGMHEKVGLIDRAVLWHGSLNPLSHSRTRESMLRIESAAVADEVFRALGLGAVASDGPGTDAVELGKACPLCESPMRRFADESLWVCSRAPDCSGVAEFAPEERTGDLGTYRQINDLVTPCPVCSSAMAVVPSLEPQIVCSGPACGFVLGGRLAGWILRALRPDDRRC